MKDGAQNRSRGRVIHRYSIPTCKWKTYRKGTLKSLLYERIDEANDEQKNKCAEQEAPESPVIQGYRVLWFL